MLTSMTYIANIDSISELLISVNVWSQRLVCISLNAIFIPSPLLALIHNNYPWKHFGVALTCVHTPVGCWRALQCSSGSAVGSSCPAASRTPSFAPDSVCWWAELQPSTMFQHYSPLPCLAVLRPWDMQIYAKSMSDKCLKLVSIAHCYAIRMLQV